MDAEQRVKAYRRQAGVPEDQPHILTAKQRRRIKQKGRRRHESGELS